MEHITEFKAYGHLNISAKHETTLMITKDNYITPRGDCIIAINSEKGLIDFSPEMIRAAQNEKTRITLTLHIDGEEFKVEGKGHPELSYRDPSDMVIRKSNYTDSRTLMIKADNVASDIPEEIVEKLRDPETEITVKISVQD
jgi:hypothetical protein